MALSRGPDKWQQLQADQDLLNDRWTNVLVAEEYGLERTTKSYPQRRLPSQFDVEVPEPIPTVHNAAEGLTDHLVAGIERQHKANTNLRHLAL